MDFFGFVGFILGILGFFLALLKYMEDREHRKKKTNDEHWVAMEFLKNFNNERWRPGFHVDKPACHKYYLDVDKLESYLPLYPDEMKGRIEQYISLTKVANEQGIRERTKQLQEWEQQLKKEAAERLEKWV